MPWTAEAFVADGQTFDEFANRFQPPLVLRSLFNENSRICPALSTAVYRADINARNAWFDTWRLANPGEPIKLMVLDTAVDSAPVVLAPPQSLESLPFRNAGCEWLTYETVLNKPKFRKTNQPRPVGMYFVQLSDMQLWIRDDMPPGALPALCDGFFPDHAPEKIELLSNASWWWKQPKELASFGKMSAPYWLAGQPVAPLHDFPALFPQTAPEVDGSRAIARLHLPDWVLMPYNYLDNDTGSRALGTAPNDVTNVLQFDLEGQQPWQFWRTASRSSVMKLTRLKPARSPWRKQGWVHWPFNEGDSDRAKLHYDVARLPHYFNNRFKTEVQKNAQLRLNMIDATYFSVKTGVCFVGFERQSGTGKKDIVGADGEWLVGAMHSDYIKAMDRLVTPAFEPAQRVVLQTEVMTMVERKTRNHDDGEKVAPVPGSDGVSVRDLSVLDPLKIYIPPLSLPFIANDFETLSEEFANVTNPFWCDSWQRNWAELLGSGKAWFMLRYGMQHANPNVQNYLLEFDNVGGNPSGYATLVIRDVADALLHREVAWALFGNPAAPPPIGGDDAAFAQLATMRLPVLRYNFRTKAAGEHSETGTTDQQFGVPGTQLLWARFSTFYATNKKTQLAECPPLRLGAVLVLLARWGRAHNANYVRTVERALGHGFEDMAWHTVPDPERYRNDTGNEALWTEDNDKEVVIQNILHAHLRSAEGQAAIRGYHNRGWRDVDPTFTVRLIDAANHAVMFTPVFLDAGATKSRMTGRDGTIPFYGGVESDYQFSVAGKNVVKTVAGNVVTLKQTA